MTEPPRRLPVTESQALTNMLRSLDGMVAGTTRAAKPVRKNVATQSGVDLLDIVFHGSDAAAARPIAALVLWIGAATPANAEDFDFWYTATIAD